MTVTSEPDHLPVFANPLLGSHAVEEHHDEKHRSSVDTAPIERPHIEEDVQVTNIELFYDLFFVANLTVFTYIHEVVDKTTLAQYVGFFGLLWFTWYQVGFYDARFAKDSVVERICKVLHFGIMIGFASIGPKFDVGEKVDAWGSPIPHEYFRSLTLVLMSSRLVLALQYLQLLWFTKHYRRPEEDKAVRAPIYVVAATYSIAAFIYFTLYWSFRPSSLTESATAEQIANTKSNRSFVAWYIIGFAETIIVTGAIHFWKFISSQPTHLQERMALLTLIILGEGVIGIAKQCQFIAQAEIFTWQMSNVGSIISALVIIYFMYMLYFDGVPKDWLEKSQFGARQAIWSLLHFPLHLCMVLAVEGLNLCIIWRAAVVAANTMSNFYLPMSGRIDEQDLKHNSDVLSNLTFPVMETAIKSSKSFGVMITGLYNLNQMGDAWDIVDTGPPANYTSTGYYQWERDAIHANLFIVTTCSDMMFVFAGFTPPKNYSDAMAKMSDYEQWTPEHYRKGPEPEPDLFEDSVKVFKLTFIYLFVCLGCYIVLCALLRILSDPQRARHDKTRLGIVIVVGLAVCFISVLTVEDQEWPFLGFVLSPWILPCLVIMILIAVVVNNLKTLWCRGRRRNHRHTSIEGISGANGQF